VAVLAAVFVAATSGTTAVAPAAAIGAIVFTPVRAHAQSNAERVTNDRYTRSHDYDLLHESIDVRNFNWDSTSFDGSVGLRLVALRAGLDSIILDAGALLRIRNVMQGVSSTRDGRHGIVRELSYTRHGDSLVVHLAKPANFGDTISFGIDYKGKVSNGRGLTFLKSEGRAHRPQQIWSQGEDMDNHFWFPTYDFPNDKATWELTSTTPRAYTSVSNGNLVSDVMNANGTRTMHWSETKPNSTYLVSLVVAPLTKVHDVWKGKPVDYYVYPEDAPLARRLFGVTPDMIEVYSNLTGIQYPWEKYAQTTVADFFGGMENVSATTLVDWLPDARAYADRPWYQWILIPHELAHQWFGDYVTTENWAHSWLNEGFAEYMPGAYWRTRKGEQTAQDYFVDEYNQFMAIDAQERMPVVTPGSNNIYPKGALVIEMLRNYLGDEAFWKSINHYLKRHAMENATTDDLRQAILDVTGQNLSWFFDQWLYQAGYPAFHVETQYDAANSRVIVVATQTQNNPPTSPSSAGNDPDAVKFTTPSVFRMPVTVRVGTAAGSALATSWIDQRTDTIIVDGVRSAPTMIIFDDGNHILKTLDFPQPVTQLAAQLERDTNLWDRQWILGQLSKSKDAAAYAALTKAGTSASYFLTRAQAARYIGGLPADIAMPALLTMMHDTSAQVRAAAVSALGRVGGATAIGAIRDAFRNDSSYAVRNAAVNAVVRADSANAGALVRAALRTSSYRDDIRNSAILATATLGDPAFVPEIAAMLGDDVRSAVALGRMAGKGSEAAAQALANALNDERAYVRAWVVTGFGNMPAPMAITRLQAALPNLRYQDTRQQVNQLISQLQERGAR
jgi:aminopeptidase N